RRARPVDDRNPVPDACRLPAAWPLHHAQGGGTGTPQPRTQGSGNAESPAGGVSARPNPTRSRAIIYAAVIPADRSEAEGEPGTIEQRGRVVRAHGTVLTSA